MLELVGAKNLTYEDIINMNPSIPDTLDFVLYSKSRLGSKKNTDLMVSLL